MSRIANNPIKISKEVECTFRDGIFSAKGKLGQMQTRVNSNYNININDNEIKVTPNIENNKDPNWGTTRAIISNIINPKQKSSQLTHTNNTHTHVQTKSRSYTTVLQGQEQQQRWSIQW